ncbi:hypothetical protein SAMN04487995_3754 [Dyadobacter koreensis]|uniref:Lipoprotein n=1 Tax=Dyadobacter koreensis TaxID=408657 RepID=A0A1H6X1D4_9BACT|nr:hypothetical protein SAMN04487995_3754 [Dyadobacter koreensis]
MKSLLLSLILVFAFSCSSSDDVNPSSGGCGTHSGHSLILGLKGGCYYLNGNGNKTYVSRSECNC